MDENARMLGGIGTPQEGSNCECPECAGAIAQKAGVEVGEVLTCRDCGTRLEIMSVAPFQLQHAPKVEEDWGE